jgi:predicted Zn-dependent protease
MANTKLKPLIWTGLLFLAISCATPRAVTVPVNTREKILKNKAAGTELSRQLDPQMPFSSSKEPGVNDPKVQAYLAATAKKLYNAVPIPQPSPSVRPVPRPSPSASPSPTPPPEPQEVQVRLIDAMKGKWESFALPGVRLYLSFPLIQKFGYENELAAAIALPMGHTMVEQGFKYLREHGDTATTGKIPVTFFGESGFFDYSDDAVLEAADAAFNMVYQAGYDPRGFLSLWALYLKNPKESPFSPALLEKLIENTRRNIALQAPLRNPIVRSEAFMAIRQRIQKR